MIDFPTSMAEEMALQGRYNATKAFSVYGCDEKSVVLVSELPNKARRLIASKPGFYIAAAFLVGGF